MAGETIITVVGNAVDAPELRFTPNGAAVAKLRIASTPRKFDKAQNAWVDDEPMFLGCNVWREMAESVAESVTKGMRLIVTGRLRCRHWETKEGERRQSWEIDVEEVGPSLKYATATVKKLSRSGGTNGGPRSTPAPATAGSSFNDQPPF